MRKAVQFLHIVFDIFSILHEIFSKFALVFSVRDDAFKTIQKLSKGKSSVKYIFNFSMPHQSSETTRIHLTAKLQ